ncbi:dihydroxyacetone kinase transcriptional activator DhaS [Lentilactobacillus sp. SPB1-3]|uniref:Dihydroxyacetone kinase transcriptional activator DhaS n=1 Tax=Lentilactobacillus terminaliae TaxID=3003483 RepID=A0ACD5DEW8_9LACO|nr:dihydroxyacetone kinase transcriptional activator DhaS [Lentilactobacillus sp. SPB1-3]MCZ0976450.1 dihydroxyacetone kinase transcriptional activator DhaS [Lentilactobacillus sp. SPB1-3]
MLTKQRIANATKQLVLTKPFNQISVTNIMQTANLRRQTFYDFFHDKYDVLQWVYQSEVKEAVSRCTEYKTWPETMVKLLTYFNDNRQFYQRVIQIDDQNAPEEIIQEHIQNMIGSILADMARQKHINVDDDYFQFVQEMLSTSLVMRLKRFLKDDSSNLVLEAKQIQFYLQDEINGLLLRLGQPIYTN